MPNKTSSKIILKTCFYIVSILLLINSTYTYNINLNNPFILKYINVKGNNYINTEEIISLISIDDKKSIFDYDIEYIKNNIEKITFIKAAYIGLKIPNRLEINIIENIPIALILHNNRKKFLDSEGDFLSVSSKSINNFPVPILNIISIDFEVNNSIPIIKHLYQNYTSLYDNISEILESDSTITLLTDNKTKIFVNPEMTISNMNKLKKFEQTINEIKSLNDYKYIDLIYKNQIVVKEKIYS